jgi:hypothetical protein
MAINSGLECGDSSGRIPPRKRSIVQACIGAKTSYAEPGKMLLKHHFQRKRSTPDISQSMTNGRVIDYRKNGFC